MANIKPLPLWVVNSVQPKIFDVDSATPIEMVAKVYGKVQEIVNAYNEFATNVNDHISKYESGLNGDFETFKVSLRQEFQDFIDVVELAFQEQSALNENFHTNAVATVQGLINTKASEFESTLDALSAQTVDELNQQVANGDFDGGYYIPSIIANPTRYRFTFTGSKPEMPTKYSDWIPIQNISVLIPYVSAQEKFVLDPSIIGDSAKYYCSIFGSVDNIPLSISGSYDWTVGVVYEAFIVNNTDNNPAVVEIPVDWEGADTTTNTITINRGNFIYLRWVKIGAKTRWWIEKNPSLIG